MIVLPIILLVIAIGISRFALQRYEQGVTLGARQTVPGALTAAEAARQFLDENEASDVKIVEHNAMVSDYFDPGRRVLFLNKAVMQGTDAASWSVALHEAAHATQQGEEKKALLWRLGNIRLARYAPTVIGIAAIILAFVKRAPRPALFACGVAFFLIAMVNAMSMAVEYNASQRVTAWLERKLRRHSEMLDLFRQILPRVAWRDTGALIRSPMYLLFGVLPVGGRLRPK
ncbi:Zn-dependent membrane protease YugP [Roseimicrobium gellanilyticum]|uniref:Zn-dependent membrane protease YugP n=1 Tax=Roseimicrobium gellanilyticum TaxID=748857 RepID=A0A366H490_9BACT|nr:zinc metallopeptidase [Roseimicrobium gellanilyticum]RBP35913.1 Zn-dependent membrane protease YugP [Roseimicrobium gellanilyticum]